MIKDKGGGGGGGAERRHCVQLLAWSLRASKSSRVHRSGRSGQTYRWSIVCTFSQEAALNNFNFLINTNERNYLGTK